MEEGKGLGVMQAPSKVSSQTFCASELWGVPESPQLPCARALLQVPGPVQGSPGPRLGRRREVSGGTTWKAASVGNAPQAANPGPARSYGNRRQERSLWLGAESRAAVRSSCGLPAGTGKCPFPKPSLLALSQRVSWHLLS